MGPSGEGGSDWRTNISTLRGRAWRWPYTPLHAQPRVWWMRPRVLEAGAELRRKAPHRLMCWFVVCGACAQRGGWVLGVERVSELHVAIVVSVCVMTCVTRW